MRLLRGHAIPGPFLLYADQISYEEAIKGLNAGAANRRFNETRIVPQTS
jgi:hypothetical protein